MDGLGCRLHLGFHPGELEGSGDPPTLQAVLTRGGGTKIKDRLDLPGGDGPGPGLDLGQNTWQVVEIPVGRGPIASIDIAGNLKGPFYLDDIRLVPEEAPTAPAREEFPTLTPFISATDTLVGLEGAVPLDIEVALQAPMGGQVPALSLDLSSVGEAGPVSLTHEGTGRYTVDHQIARPLGNGVYHLPVLITAGERQPELLAVLGLSVFPAEDRILWADGLTPEWTEPHPLVATLEPEATSRVYKGQASLSLQSVSSAVTRNYLTWEPAETVERFGYNLRLAFHPGELERAGDPPAFNAILKTIADARPEETVELLGRDGDRSRLDLRQNTWQVVEVPVGVGQIQSITFAGNLRGTFYLDDIRLVPQEPPPGDGPPSAVLEASQNNAPTAFSLDQNYPNPFNSGTVFRFALPRGEEAEL